MVFTIFVSVVAPILLLIILSAKKIIPARAVLAGAACFMLFQVIIRLPIVSMFKAPDKVAQPGGFFLYIALLAVTAGLVETLGRFLFGKFFLKDMYCFKTAVGFGLGAGATESVLLAGLGTIANLASSVLVNKGGGNLIASMGEENYYAAVEALKSINPIEYYCIGFERIMAMLIHIMLTALVILALKRAKPVLLLIPFGIHTLFDFSVSYMAQMINSPAAAGAALVFGIVAVVVTVKLRPILDSGYTAQPKSSEAAVKKVDISDYLN